MASRHEKSKSGIDPYYGMLLPSEAEPARD